MIDKQRSDANPTLGPLAKEAIRVDVGGRKRRRLYVLLAAYLDAGVDDPSIRELRRRAALKDMRLVLTLLRRLEHDGWIAIHGRGHGERNRYELICTSGHGDVRPTESDGEVPRS